MSAENKKFSLRNLISSLNGRNEPKFTEEEIGIPDRMIHVGQGCWEGARTYSTDTVRRWRIEELRKEREEARRKNRWRIFKKK